MPSPDTGEPVSVAYLLPRSTDDLVRKREMIAFLARRTGGAVGRLPEYIANIVMGLYDVREVLAEEDPAFAGNAPPFFPPCPGPTPSASLGFADPHPDRRRPPGDVGDLP